MDEGSVELLNTLMDVALTFIENPARGREMYGTEADRIVKMIRDRILRNEGVIPL